MPEEDDYALFFCLLVPLDGFIDGAVVIGLPVEPGVVGGVVLHVESSD